MEHRSFLFNRNAINTGVRNCFIVLFISMLCNVVQGADDSFVAVKADTMPVIDGIANDSCWKVNQWYGLDYVWLPYGDQVSKTDFSGRFKLSWTKDRLLLLVEIVDDSLYDGHSNPLDNYWNDDCVEIFLDEDHSGGAYDAPPDPYNAWAYHVSIYGDVVDPYGPALFNDHMKVAWTRHDSLYTWEFAIKMYGDDYVNDQVSVPDTLTNNKIMGFSLAYCDDDGSGVRENFIGSKYLPEAESNDSYLNASLFSTLTLVDPNAQTSSIRPSKETGSVFFPNPVKNSLNFKLPPAFNAGGIISLIDMSGKKLITKKLTSGQSNGDLDLSHIASGIYFVVSSTTGETITQKIIVE